MLQLQNLFGERSVLLLENLNLDLQLCSPARLKNNSRSRRQQNGSDDSFLQSSHSNGFDDSGGGSAGQGGSGDERGSGNGGAETNRRGLDGVCGDGKGESICADGHAAPDKEFTETFHGPGDPFLGSV